MVFGIVQVAALGELAHDQVVLDQPGDGRDFVRTQAEARPQLAGDARADDGVILVAALGDIVQEQRRRRARGDCRCSE